MKSEFDKLFETIITLSFFHCSDGKSISFDAINDKTLFPDLPPGPLDRYRKNVTFDWRRLAIILDGERCLRFQVCKCITDETVTNKLKSKLSRSVEYGVEIFGGKSFICSFI